MSAAQKLRGAIIGCGYISEFHLRGWARIPEVELCALVDPDEARAQDRRARFAPAARIYPGMEQLLAGESLDFVDILSPPGLHRQQCLLAAQAGLHIVCQKPLCDRLAEARDLVGALRNHRGRFVVHENHRYRPWFREILRLTSDGSLGRLRHLEFVQHDATEPAQKVNTEGEHGVMLQYGVHLVDMIHALLGVPQRVQARMLRGHPRVRGESQVHTVLEYPEATAILNVSWKQTGVQQGHVLVIGDRGEAFYEGAMTRAERARFRVFAGNTVVRDELRSPTDDYVESFYQFERDFADCLLHGTPPPQPASENLRLLTTTFAAYESARTGAPVALVDFASPQ